MDEFRASLPANDFAGILRLTGSFVSSDVRDYYKTPFDMGYGHIVKFDHDFVGFEALKKLDQEKAQKNVTLVWNSEDAGRLLAEMSNPDGKRVRTLHLPVNGDKLEINYDLLTAQDQAVGHGFYTGYSANERGIFTSGLVDHDIQIGNEVVLHWGDANDADGEVFPIRATVGPTPYSAVARTEYASGWRQKVFA
jgi:vanillate/3-O-methylgallate O-demethylase